MTREFDMKEATTNIFRQKVLLACFGFSLAAILFFCARGISAQQKPLVIHVGYFPNITHAQALIGRAGGQFDTALGTGVQIEWKSFNAGPAAVEALFAGAVDVTYIGPNPAVMGYVRSEGEAVRLIAGAASGGAALVVRQGAGIQNISDFHGKKIATPQQGNSQDVALRAWLHSNGMNTADKGGDVQVLPINNAYQYTLFLKGELDAAWSPEPWASRLIHEAGGRIFLDERDKWPNHEFASTVLIVRPQFLKEHPDLVKNFLRAHVELTDWIDRYPDQAKLIINQQLKKETGKALQQAVLEDAFSRIKVTYDPVRSSLVTSTQQAFEAGFLGHKQPDISGLYDLTLLNEVLLEKKAQPLQ
jgi:NitT/TauT family transport system substrate-binding protein